MSSEQIVFTCLGLLIGVGGLMMAHARTRPKEAVSALSEWAGFYRTRNRGVIVIVLLLAAMASIVYLSVQQRAKAPLDLAFAKLVFSRLEPYEQRFLTTDGGTISYPSFKVWFKNVGQSATQKQSFAIIPFVTANLLSEKDEGNYFQSLKNADDQYKLKIESNDIQPGQNAYFLQAVGINEKAWADFNSINGTLKYLYVMSLLSYNSENLDEVSKVITETCLIFQSGNLSDWLNCRSGHNTTYKLN
jgi:hypothetical protein